MKAWEFIPQKRGRCLCLQPHQPNAVEFKTTKMALFQAKCYDFKTQGEGPKTGRKPRREGQG